MQNLNKLKNSNKMHFMAIQRHFYKLVKYNPQSDEDFELCGKLTIKNIKYSALQKLLPLNEIDINNQEQIEEYFTKDGNLEKLRPAFEYMTGKNNEVEKIGYHKIIDTQNNNAFVGHAGFIILEAKDGIANKIERGIHIDPEYRDNKLGASTKQGSVVMNLCLDNLEQNTHEVNFNGTLLSSILKTNIRSQQFTLKNKLNIGKPTSEDELTYKWEQNNGTFINRIPEIRKNFYIQK
jgi:hypothetical protein